MLDVTDGGEVSFGLAAPDARGDVDDDQAGGADDDAADDATDEPRYDGVVGGRGPMPSC